ncbi:hypothetical protein MMC24_007351 [Lignoscripta atroalba]|nr:hypothetical protein [Lignoscripta atroalba]
MILNVHSPRPVRSPKRALDDIDPDCVPTNKHRRLQSPAPLPTPPPVYDQLSEVPPPSSTPRNRPSSTPSQPKPVGPLKRPLEVCDSDCASTSKGGQLRLQSPTSLPTPSRGDNCLPEVLRPSSAPPQPKSGGPSKGALEDCDLGYAPASKRHRPLSPTPPTIYDWLSNVRRTSSPPNSRPRSAPAQFSGRETLAAIDEPIYQPTSLATVGQMSQQPGQALRPDSITSGQSSRPSTSSPVYRSILANNYVIMDHTGTQIPEEVRAFIDTHILKGRSSPLLTGETVR